MSVYWPLCQALSLLFFWNSTDTKTRFIFLKIEETASHSLLKRRPFKIEYRFKAFDLHMSSGPARCWSYLPKIGL